ncbi:zinc finger, CCHC-type containing protein [Tanacetum coccineum]
MTKMFSLLKELTKSKSPEKVLVREEVSSPITKYVKAISLVRIENNKGTESDMVVDKNVIELIKLVDKEVAMDEEEDNEPNENNHEYNDSLLATRLGKMDNETYNSLPVGPMYTEILKKKLAKKDERGGVAEDVLIDVAGFVYPMDFVILDIKEDECMPLILGTPFLTTTKAEIKFDRGRMTIRAGNCKIRFVRTLEHPSKIEERIKRDLDPIILTNHVNKIILEWEERIKNHQEKEMGLNKWRSKVFDDKYLIRHNFFIYVLGSEGCNVNKGGVT